VQVESKLLNHVKQLPKEPRLTRKSCKFTAEQSTHSPSIRLSFSLREISLSQNPKMIDFVCDSIKKLEDMIPLNVQEEESTKQVSLQVLARTPTRLSQFSTAVANCLSACSQATLEIHDDDELQAKDCTARLWFVNRPPRRAIAIVPHFHHA
jgi:hypothetical protein